MKQFIFFHESNGSLVVTAETYNDATDIMLDLVRHFEQWSCEDDEGEEI